MKAVLLFGVVAADVNVLFDKFKQTHNKKYDSPTEELRRYKNFVDNVAWVELLNKIDDGAAYTTTGPFADWSEEEFAARNTLQVTREELRKQELLGESLPLTDVPTSWDWETKGGVVPVKNQGMCGSCWSFGTAASIEGANFVTNKKLISLSEQELVDCDTTDHGCNGGLPSNAYQWLIHNKFGLEAEEDYSYVGKQDKCTIDQSKMKVYPQRFLRVQTNEDQIAKALVQYGSLAIGINAAAGLQMYHNGIMDLKNCNPYQLDHAVTIVGYGEEDGVKFWKIKNSWGEAWGEDGYFRIVRGKGMCGLNRMVTAVVVNKEGEDEPATELFI